MKIKEYQEHFWVEFDNAVRIEVYTEDKNCGGIGRVKCGRTDLRCDDLPVLPLVTTAEGYQVQKVDIEDVHVGEDEEEVVITMRPYLSTCGHVDLEAGDVPQWNVGEWNQSPERDRGGELQLTLREVNRVVGGREMRGFSYSYKFRSRKYHPKFIHYRGTWELAGSATRNELIVPAKEGCPHKHIQNKKDEFSSCELEEDRLRVQFKHLFSEMQGFTYQYDNHSILLTGFETPVDCQSVIQKDSGQNYIVQWHQISGGKSSNGGSMQAPPHQVLCADVEADSPEERYNQYHAIKVDMHNSMCDMYDIPPQEASIPGFLGREIWHRSDEVQRGIEKLADVGCEEIVMPDLTHESNTKHHYDEGYGSKQVMDLLDEAVEAIHTRDLDAGMQVDASALMKCLGEEKGGIAKSDVKDWVKDILEEVDVDSLYLVSDSSGSVNAGGKQARYGRLIPANVEIGFHQAVTQAGLRSGSSGFGPFGLVLGDIPFEGIRKKEWLYSNTIMEFPYVDVIEGQGNPKDAYFRGLANRLCYGVTFGSDDGVRPELPDWLEHDYVALNTAFKAVREYMIHPCQLGEQRGVLWAGSQDEDAVKVLWAFSEFSVETGDNAHVYDVMRARQIEIGEEETSFTTEEKCVYMLEGEVECP